MLENGYELLKNYVSPDKLNTLSNSLSLHDIGERKGGIRNIEKKNKVIYEFCYSKDMLSLARRYLSDDATLVRAIYFNKTQRNNWLVPWHQDKTVAVSKKFEATGWTSWSIKDGEHHVQPPIDVLNQIVTFRLHIDDSTPENGCLNLIPQSHNFGLLNQTQINECLSRTSAYICSATKGSVLVMRPHILHSSIKATQPNSRRVLHLEFSNYSLPKGVSWA